MYIPSEMPFVSFDLIVWNACGKKEMVVAAAARYPAIFIQSMFLNKSKDTMKFLKSMAVIKIAKDFFSY